MAPGWLFANPLQKAAKKGVGAADAPDLTLKSEQFRRKRLSVAQRRDALVPQACQVHYKGNESEAPALTHCRGLPK